MWPEINIVIKENRHELVLSADNLNKNLKSTNDEIDPKMYYLTGLNYLSLSDSYVSLVSEKISDLTSLTMLVLQANKLTSLPESICSLHKLKLLNVSENKLRNLPKSLGEMQSLATLNANHNQIITIPSLKKCSHLAHLDLSYNEIENFDELCDATLLSLADVNLSNNKIINSPSSMKCLPSLKCLNLNNNKLKEMPNEVGLCAKLRELHLKSNILSDHKLRKLVEADHTQPKHVVDFFKKHSKMSKKNMAAKKTEINLSDSNNHVTNVINVASWSNVISVTASHTVKEVRSYLVCSIVKNLDLSDESKLKKFLSIQTKLHEGLCEKRVIATIATHDLMKISSPIIYIAKPPNEICVHPLNYAKALDAPEYFKSLLNEADSYRRQHKKNSVSGIHKYLHLVKDWSVWPCLYDAQDRVISLPPLTNSEITRIDKTTTSVFIEVTSSCNLQIAKKVLDTLIENIILSGLRNEYEENLVVQQVKVVSEDGTLKVMYPSRMDLEYDPNRIRVIRNF